MKMSKHVCPPWVGYWLASPLRRLIHNPCKILSPYVTSGMTVLDIGPAMGFFSLPLASLIGPGGKVICVDLQEKMLLSLQRRARKAGLEGRVLTRTCTAGSLCLDDLNGKIDFALVFAVVHEVNDIPEFFEQVFDVLKPGALCLVAEPAGHVSLAEFRGTLAIAGQKGLCEAGSPRIAWSRAAVLKKTSGFGSDDAIRVNL